METNALTSSHLNNSSMDCHRSTETSFTFEHRTAQKEMVRYETRLGTAAYDLRTGYLQNVYGSYECRPFVSA